MRLVDLHTDDEGGDRYGYRRGATRYDPAVETVMDAQMLSEGFRVPFRFALEALEENDGDLIVTIAQLSEHDKENVPPPSRSRIENVRNMGDVHLDRLFVIT